MAMAVTGNVLGIDSCNDAASDLNGRKLPSCHIA